MNSFTSQHEIQLDSLPLEWLVQQKQCPTIVIHLYPEERQYIMQMILSVEFYLHSICFHNSYYILLPSSMNLVTTSSCQFKTYAIINTYAVKNIIIPSRAYWIKNIVHVIRKKKSEFD